MEQTAALHTILRVCVWRVALHAKLRRVRIGECAAQKLQSSGSHGTAAMRVTQVPATRMRRVG